MTKIPELSVMQAGSKVTVRVVAEGGRLEQIIQLLTDGNAVPDWEKEEYDGLLSGVEWEKPYLNGEKYLFTAAARTPRYRFALAIQRVAVGYDGTGSRTAVAVLRQLGIGEVSFLTNLLCQPHPLPGMREGEAWKRVFVPSEFGQQYA